jgi:hypothetical protein
MPGPQLAPLVPQPSSPMPGPGSPTPYMPQALGANQSLQNMDPKRLEILKSLLLQHMRGNKGPMGPSANPMMGGPGAMMAQPPQQPVDPRFAAYGAR